MLVTVQDIVQQYLLSTALSKREEKIYILAKRTNWFTKDVKHASFVTSLNFTCNFLKRNVHNQASCTLSIDYLQNSFGYTQTCIQHLNRYHN